VSDTYSVVQTTNDQELRWYPGPKVNRQTIPVGVQAWWGYWGDYDGSLAWTRPTWGWTTGSGQGGDGYISTPSRLTEGLWVRVPVALVKKTIPVVPHEQLGNYIIWNPSYPHPPKTTYTTESQAFAVARKMAERFPGDLFIVCPLGLAFRVEPAPPPPSAEAVAAGLRALAGVMGAAAHAMATRAILRASKGHQPIFGVDPAGGAPWTIQDYQEAYRWLQARLSISTGSPTIEWFLSAHMPTPHAWSTIVREMLRYDVLPEHQRPSYVTGRIVKMHRW
jgi:hypothetical protein